MKKIRFCCLVLGLIIGGMLSFFFVRSLVLASDVIPDGYSHFWSYSYENQVYEQFCESSLFESGQIAIYELDGYYYPIAARDADWCGTLNGKLGYVRGKGPYSVIKDGMIGCSFFVPIFSSLAECESYFATGDFTGALNYDELQLAGAIYDSSIAAPSKLYINSLSAASVTAVWEYSDNSYEGLQYKVQVENYYAAQSFAYAVLGGSIGSGVDQTIKLNGYINSLNQLTCKHTVEGYLKNPSGGLDEEILVSGIIDKSSGDMHSIDTYISVPVDYSDQFVYSGNPFFQGVTNAKHPVYLGSQVTVIPYRVVDGVRYKGNTVVCRRFVNSGLNMLVGSTFTEIGSDSNGNSYINRTEDVDITGESTSGSIGIGDTGTFFSFLNQLMYMLANQGALLGVFNNLLSSVPAYIWVLIGFSIVVGIVAMIAKFA